MNRRQFLQLGMASGVYALTSSKLLHPSVALAAGISKQPLDVTIYKNGFSLPDVDIYIPQYGGDINHINFARKSLNIIHSGISGIHSITQANDNFLLLNVQWGSDTFAYHLKTGKMLKFSVPKLRVLRNEEKLVFTGHGYFDPKANMLIYPAELEKPVTTEKSIDGIICFFDFSTQELVHVENSGGLSPHDLQRLDDSTLVLSHRGKANNVLAHHYEQNYARAFKYIIERPNISLLDTKKRKITKSFDIDSAHDAHKKRVGHFCITDDKKIHTAYEKYMLNNEATNQYLTSHYPDLSYKHTVYNMDRASPGQIVELDLETGKANFHAAKDISSQLRHQSVAYNAHTKQSIVTYKVSNSVAILDQQMSEVSPFYFPPEQLAVPTGISIIPNSDYAIISGLRGVALLNMKHKRIDAVCQIENGHHSHIGAFAT